MDYIEKSLVLSTGHISERTNELLYQMHNHPDIRVVSHEYGHIIFVSDDTPGPIDDMPELIPIVTLARTNNCTLINLDRDAEVIPHLPTFKW